MLQLPPVLRRRRQGTRRCRQDREVQEQVQEYHQEAGLQKEGLVNVALLRHTPEPERTVAMAARLCYSASTISELEGKAPSGGLEKFLGKILKLGHLSVLEHASFTFGIEGISRATSRRRCCLSATFAAAGARSGREGTGPLSRSRSLSRSTSS